MFSTDDIAMAYEAIIRRCYSCERYKHGADADVFRRLQNIVVDYSDPESRTSKDELKSEYYKLFKSVVGNLVSALHSCGQKEFDLYLGIDTIDAIIPSFEKLVYTLGMIESTLNK